MQTYPHGLTQISKCVYVLHVHTDTHTRNDPKWHRYSSDVKMFYCFFLTVHMVNGNSVKVKEKIPVTQSSTKATAATKDVDMVQ